MNRLAGFGFLGSFTSLGVSACCVLPMLLMLAGVGGSWIAIFGQISAASFYILGATTLFIAAAWALAWRRGSLRHLARRLGASTIITGLAWAIALNEAGLNDYLISWM